MAGCSPGAVSTSLAVKAARQEPAAQQELLRQELLQGLLQERKSINPKFFYDERGSQLFEQIMGLPEYYPSRTELSILEQYKADIASHLGMQQVLIEPGAGNCEKVKTLLPALRPKCYMPVDISAEFLNEAASRLQADFPSVDVRAVAGDMDMRYPIPGDYLGLRKVVFYPGSTIGNYEPDRARLFLQQLHQQLGVDDGLLIGVDLQKPVDTLHAAYNDRQGVTALFNLNILNHVNAIADANFDVTNFTRIPARYSAACFGPETRPRRWD